MSARKDAWIFILLMGLVALFADMTYEGARSISGPYLATLGAGATVVGIVSGFGEFMGYGLRLLSGYWADKSKQYWPISFLGYVMNLLAVPLLAFANRWELAALLLILERAGRGLRNPPRDAMLSHATHAIGTGTGFGVHEFLDQLGAIAGPLIVSAILYYQHNYTLAFGSLIVPALCSLALLLIAFIRYPKPENLEHQSVHLTSRGFPPSFWLFCIASGLIAAGYADFPLLAYHLAKTKSASPTTIPILYSVTMAIDAFAALALGKMFDRFGVSVLMVALFIGSLFAPLAFLGNFSMILIALVAWGIGMATQETIMKAAIANMVPPDKRSSAFGVFGVIFGSAWFAGSALMGMLYDFNIHALVIFSLTVQILSLPLFYFTGSAVHKVKEK